MSQSAVKREISHVRRQAGRAGALARWGERSNEPTVQIRVYRSDAARLRALADGTVADTVRKIMSKFR